MKIKMQIRKRITFIISVCCFFVLISPLDSQSAVDQKGKKSRIVRQIGLDEYKIGGLTLNKKEE